MKNNNYPKILLINPPSEFKTPILPLGLASIAAYLETKNIDVSISIIDAWAEELSFDKLSNRVNQSEADIIGIYMLSPRYDQAKKTIEICRQVSPNSVIIAGGPHPSAMPIKTLEQIPELDVCCVGEGEVTMYEFVKAIQNSSDLSMVNGIAYRDGNKGLILTQPREYIANLDNLPLPARQLFPLEKYRTHPPYGRKNPFFSIMTSRGCPFNCAYCSKDVFKRTYRGRSPENVCNEIEELISKYNAQEIHFYDDDFTLDMKRAEAICDEIIRRKIKIIWSCLTRVDLINETLLKKMEQAGCWLISYGVESGNQQILNIINKGIKLDQVTSAFKMTRRVGIRTLGYFMIGLPGETKQSIRQTIDLSKKIKPNFVSWSILTVFPGSFFFRQIQQGKYQGQLKVLDKKKNMAGTFSGKGNFMTLEDNLTIEQMRKAVKQANLEFYLRPNYVFQCLKDIRSLADFKYYLSGGLEVIKSVIG